MTRKNDQQLISQYLAGDEQSLEVLIRLYLKPVHGFAYTFVGNTQDAEEIAQETFMKMWRNLKKFDREKNFKTWLFSIAKSAAIDFLRKRKAIPFSAFENAEGENAILETLADTSPSPSELYEQKSLGEILATAVKKLSPKYFKVISLHANDQLTFREISEETREPLHTVKSRYRRALITLKDILLK